MPSAECQNWAAIGVVVALLVLWLWLRHARKRYVLLYKSSGTDQLAHELRRIADALERMASERRPDRPSEEHHARSTIVPSMFGRQ